MKRRRFLTAALTCGSLLLFCHTAASAETAPSGEPLFAVLLGGNEVSATGEANAGDQNGIGSATVLIRGTRLCYGIAAFGIAPPTLAHIHQEAAGRNGPIVVDLDPPDQGNAGTSGGCVSVDPDLLSAIRRAPHGFYVNVHNGPFPSGALRGHLF